MMTQKEKSSLDKFITGFSCEVDPSLAMQDDPDRLPEEEDGDDDETSPPRLIEGDPIDEGEDKDLETEHEDEDDDEGWDDPDDEDEEDE